MGERRRCSPSEFGHATNTADLSIVNNCFLSPGFSFGKCIANTNEKTRHTDLQAKLLTAILSKQKLIIRSHSESVGTSHCCRLGSDYRVVISKYRVRIL